MKNVLVAMPFLDALQPYLDQFGQDCAFTYTLPKDATKEQVCSADIIFGNVPPELVAQSNQLQWMQLNSSGADAYCKPGILKPGTLLTCATGAYGLAVSEGMLALTYTLCRKLDLYEKNQQQRYWHEEGSITSVYGSTTLLLGLGDIGCEYAARMKALGSYIIGIRKNTAVKPDCVDEVHSLDELDELLPRADFVTMILPSTPETYHLMDERKLRLMKKGAYLINGGRGDAVDCEALNRVLREGNILGGAGLDVTDPEPLPADHPLWDAPRCVITPHAAGRFHLHATVERISAIAGENLAKFLTGDFDQMRNLVDPETGYRKK